MDWHFLEHFKSSCLGLFFPVLEQVAALKATTTRRHNSPRRKPIVQVGLKNPDSLLHRQSYAFEAFLLFTVTTLESEDRRSSPLRCSAPPLPVQRPKNGQTPEPPSTSSHSGGPFCGVVLPDCPAFSSGSPAGSSSFLLSDDRPKRKTDKSARGF